MVYDELFMTQTALNKAFVLNVLTSTMQNPFLSLGPTTVSLLIPTYHCLPPGG